MEIACLDLEGVLVPEIWVAFAEESGAFLCVVGTEMLDRPACEALARETNDDGPAVLMGLPWGEGPSVFNAVTLLDGRELTDPVHTWNCPVVGTTDLGPLTIPLEQFARVEFAR